MTGRLERPKAKSRQREPHFAGPEPEYTRRDLADRATVVFSLMNFRGLCVQQDGLEPFDLRLDAYKTGHHYYATWIVHGANGVPRKMEIDVELFDFDHVLELSHSVIQRVEYLVENTEFKSEALADPELLERLKLLNAELYMKRISTGRTNLRDVFAELLAGTGPPSIIVGGAMRLVPWELTTPDGAIGVAGMLGSRAHLVGATHSEPIRTVSGRPVYRPKSRLNILGVNDAVRIRTIGNMSLTGAEAEAELIKNPGSRAWGSIAPALEAGADKTLFFEHFGLDGYDLVHVFAHCDYDAGVFRLGVSDKVDVTRSDFNQYDVRFPSKAFHFLNLCQGAPTPNRKEYAFVDYLALQQDAGGVVAPLTSVRSSAAVAMARAFYARFLPDDPDGFGRSASEAIMSARTALWEQGEATGYLYRAFGRHDLVLGPVAKILEAENV